MGGGVTNYLLTGMILQVPSDFPSWKKWVPVIYYHQAPNHQTSTNILQNWYYNNLWQWVPSLKLTIENFAPKKLACPKKGSRIVSLCNQLFKGENVSFREMIYFTAQNLKHNILYMILYHENHSIIYVTTTQSYVLKQNKIPTDTRLRLLRLHWRFIWHKVTHWFDTNLIMTNLSPQTI